MHSHTYVGYIQYQLPTKLQKRHFKRSDQDTKAIGCLVKLVNIGNQPMSEDHNLAILV